jgi:hypothetical protein
MRKLLLLTVCLAPLIGGDPAVAQSGQGGYLGLNAGAHAGTAGPVAPQLGSLQGGYLGRNAGATLKPPTAASAADYLTEPAAWCANSPVPGRCRNRAAADHAWCIANASPERYATCRRTMDFMGWPP